jgi:alpha-2-macroglobulin
VANAWGALAVERFSRAFESTPVAGITTAALGSASKRVDWSRSPKGGTLAFAWPPDRQEMTVDHVGPGRPWVTLESRAAIPPTAPVASGFRVEKRVTAVDPARASTSAPWKAGDLVRVHLDIEAESDMTWVVVDDPIPAGASHLGAGLGGQSRLGSRGEERSNRVRPAFVERGFEGFRAYYAYVPKGRFAVEYTVRLNQSGTFQLPATRVEALYAPEMFGERPNPAFRIEP